MPGNTIGKFFCVTSFGESHGPAIGCIIDGCPPGFELNEDLIQPFLDKRRPGQSKFTTQRREPDAVKILSGVFEGKTTGTPIGLLIENVDQRSRDYSDIKEKYRPGHADFTYDKKYGFRDYRGGGRSSARETAMRVAAGSVARLILKQVHGITIRAYLAQMGTIKLSVDDLEQVDNNAFFCPNNHQISQLEQAITDLRKQGDSIGARINVIAENIPPGLGEPVFDRLDADIAHAMMSINAAKAVEVGAGFDCVTQHGSEHRDEMDKSGFLSNNAGGILGGISTGQAITASVAFKATSSITKPGKTINRAGDECEIITTGRHDPCVGIRAVPIVEAMLAIVLMDHYLAQRALRGDKG